MILNDQHTKAKVFKSLHKSIRTGTVIGSFSIDTMLRTNVSIVVSTFINI